MRRFGVDGYGWVTAAALLVAGCALWAGAALAEVGDAAAPPTPPSPDEPGYQNPVPVVAGEAAPSALVLRSQLGIIYAHNGQREHARQEFLKLLEDPQGRATGLTNLGNLDFLEGKVQEALQSYKQAAALDGEDPGILLNEGLALKQLGKTDEAEKVFASAVQMAGGVERASFLLGLPSAEDTGRGKVSKMTADEVRQMLLKAKAGVPTTQVPNKPAESTTKVTSRPGGARAAEVSVGEQNLYWKEQ